MDLITHISIDNIESFDYSENSISEYEKFLDTIGYLTTLEELNFYGAEFEDDASFSSLKRFCCFIRSYAVWNSSFTSLLLLME